MLFWGIILTFAGIVGIEDGGGIFLFIGIVLIFVGAINSESSNSNSSTNSYGIYDKITYIINFLEYLSKNADSKDKINYMNQLEFFQKLRSNFYNLNYDGITYVNQMYTIVRNSVDNYRNTLLGDFDKYLIYYETNPLAISLSNLNDMRNEIETTNDFNKLDVISNVIRYLMLINSNLEISRMGYYKYNTFPGFPEFPQKIHIEAVQLLITKCYLDEMDSSVLQYIYNHLYDDQLYSEGDLTTFLQNVKSFFKKILEQVEKKFEKDNIEEIVPILLMVDNEFQKKYSPNRKSYEVLGLSPNASKEEIDRAYKKLLVTSHPDRGGDEAKWSEINEAYAKIKNSDHLNTEISIPEESEEEPEEEKTEDKKYTCADCGTYIDETDKECPKCGAIFEEE